MYRRCSVIALVLCVTLTCVPQAPAAVPYFNPGPFVIPFPSSALPAPVMVPGKEFSDFLPPIAGPFGDRDPFGVLDPEQNIAWDGNFANPGGGAGVDFGFDYSGSRILPGGGVDMDRQVDAIASSGDALFQAVRADTTHMLFSVSSLIPGTPVFGPIGTTGGNAIGGTGDVTVELSGAPIQFPWAIGPIDIDSMTPPHDVDGLEIWGPDPALGLPTGIGGDANRYSLDFDFVTGVSVWAYSDVGPPGVSTPYVPHAAIVAAVAAVIGGDGLPDGTFDPNQQRELIDLDALMVFDHNFDDTFETTDAPDTIYFSIHQVPDPTDPDGFYATGSEIFILDSSGFAAYLPHGGHLWDHGYALADMKDVTTGIQLDLNALEAVSTIPEPAGIAIFAFVLCGLGIAGRRRRT